MITEFLRSSEEERQSQAKLLEREKREEMELLSQCHSEQFRLRTKETLRMYPKYTTREVFDKYFFLFKKKHANLSTAFSRHGGTAGGRTAD